MQREIQHSALLVAAVAVLGCGGASGTNANHGLYINAALGIDLIQTPITVGATPEGPLSGIVSVTRGNADGEPVMATLTLNGVEVPEQSLFGTSLGYDFSKASVSSVMAGSTLQLHAAFGSESGDLAIVCPSEVTITEPAEGSSASVGNSITVSWSGTIDYGSPIKPDVMVHGFDPQSGSKTTLTFADRVESGKQSDTFNLPDPMGAPEWLIDLFAPGVATNNDAGAGVCILDRRVHLVAQ